MDIPVAWMERLFSLLHAQYGNRMTTMWGDCPPADVKDAWRSGLAGVDAERIKAGLAALPAAHPEWPPTLGEFLALCRRPVVVAAHREFVALPRQKREAIPANVREKLDALTAKWRAA